MKIIHVLALCALAALASEANCQSELFPVLHGPITRPTQNGVPSAEVLGGLFIIDGLAPSIPAAPKYSLFSLNLSYDLQAHEALSTANYAIIPRHPVWLFKSLTWDVEGGAGMTIGAHAAPVALIEGNLMGALPKGIYWEISAGGASVTGGKPGLILGASLGRRF